MAGTSLDTKCVIDSSTGAAIATGLLDFILQTPSTVKHHTGPGWEGSAIGDFVNSEMCPSLQHLGVDANDIVRQITGALWQYFGTNNAARAVALEQIYDVPVGVHGYETLMDYISGQTVNTYGQLQRFIGSIPVAVAQGDQPIDIDSLPCGQALAGAFITFINQRNAIAVYQDLAIRAEGRLHQQDAISSFLKVLTGRDGEAINNVRPGMIIRLWEAFGTAQSDRADAIGRLYNTTIPVHGCDATLMDYLSDSVVTTYGQLQEFIRAAQREPATEPATEYDPPRERPAATTEVDMTVNTAVVNCTTFDRLIVGNWYKLECAVAEFPAGCYGVCIETDNGVALAVLRSARDTVYKLLTNKHAGGWRRTATIYRPITKISFSITE